MVTKEFSKNGGLVKVTFELPASVGTDEVYVIGEFNDWTPTQPMVHDDEHWHCTIDLEPGREYQFRYLVNHEIWLNDPEADKYVPNPFGSDNSVIVIVTPQA